MRSEEEIKGEIEERENLILTEVGLMTRETIQYHIDWIECLQWVLEEEGD